MSLSVVAGCVFVDLLYASGKGGEGVVRIEGWVVVLWRVRGGVYLCAHCSEGDLNYNERDLLQISNNYPHTA
jgi:hypothetical protein